MPLVALALVASSSWGHTASSNVLLGGTVVRAYPHDRTAFTQGLVHWSGRLFESVGQYGQSAVREISLPSGRVVREVKLPADRFGEGLTVWRGRLVQLTWLNERAILYDPSTLIRLGELSYSGPGWGLTSDRMNLVMTDGSDMLYFRHPETFRVVRTVRVTLGGRPLRELNELEWVDGAIYANLRGRDTIMVIDPSTGHAEPVFDVAPLRRKSGMLAVGELNGIAYNARSRTFLITGKNWPLLFEVDLHQARSPTGHRREGV